MLRTIIAICAVTLPVAAFAADIADVRLIERDGMKYQYSTSPAPFGGVTITGRELASSSSLGRSTYTLHVSPKGHVTGEYGGSPVNFTVAGFDPAALALAMATPDSRVTTK